MNKMVRGLLYCVVFFLVLLTACLYAYCMGENDALGLRITKANQDDRAERRKVLAPIIDRLNHLSAESMSKTTQ